MECMNGNEGALLELLRIAAHSRLLSGVDFSVDESEEITVAVRADDLLEGYIADPERHPIAIALRRQDNVDDARVTKNETLVRRGKKWFRYDAPDKQIFRQLQRTLTGAD